MNKSLIVIGLLALSSSAVSAKVCSVSNFDTSGCQPGDELMYLPGSWGNEQLPVEFVAKKCDLAKTVVWTKGGVTCIYVPNKEVVNGHEVTLKKSYEKLYKDAAGPFSSWTKMDNGSYWKIREQGKGAALKLGDKVHLQEKNCRHDPDGSEYPQDDYHDGGTIDKLTKDHYLYQIKANRGAIVEIIAETYHGYVKVD